LGEKRGRWRGRGKQGGIRAPPPAHHHPLPLSHNPHSLPSIINQQGKIKSLEQVYLFSMPVKEYQIVESFLGPALKDEVMKVRTERVVFCFFVRRASKTTCFCSPPPPPQNP
jgi:small subunit ribosomal protein S2e